MAASLQGTQAPHLHWPGQSAAFPLGSLCPNTFKLSESPGQHQFKVIFQVGSRAASRIQPSEKKAKSRIRSVMIPKIILGLAQTLTRSKLAKLYAFDTLEWFLEALL